MHRHIGIDHVVPHEQRKGHPDEYGEQSQEVILDSDHFVIEAEDILSDPAVGA